MIKPLPRLRLHGFNNLTKSLSFNIYDVCLAADPKQRAAYIEYINETYNAQRLTDILTEVAGIIGATILNVARQDYEPQGASVTMLISEAPMAGAGTDTVSAQPGPLPESIVTHLDKSHLTVHTYPESNPASEIATFRADIDVSTCGVVSPLRALNYLIHSFESDVVVLDYRIRGVTRDIRGRKHFKDHKINSIQDFLTKDTKATFQMLDVNVYQENLFHTKMMLADFDLDRYLFGVTSAELASADRRRYERRLRREIAELYYGRNM
ncbi:MAG: adenosylmethionine decarboxylase [Pseudomonadota bacterium]